MRVPPPAWSTLAGPCLDGVVGILTDIDDTLTRDGRIEPEARAALEALHAARLPVFAITGRPMGWSEPFARDWPLEAIVAENGAVALFRQAGRLQVEYVQDAATRERNAQRLREVLERIERQVAGACRARDSAGRVTDIAIDHSEFVRLPAERIAEVLAIMQAAGMTATVSSIHVNGWFGEHTKLTGADWIVRRRLGRELACERERWIFVGDSPNDQAMFGAFPLSVGVANIRDFSDRLRVWPGWITAGERGKGFAEVAAAVLSRHSTSAGMQAPRLR